MKVYIIRHGETQFNRLGILQGNINSQLLDESKEKAKKIIKWAEDMSFDFVFSSDLDRAFETATIISNGKYNICKNKYIGEMTFGDWQGKTKEEIFLNEEYKKEYNNYFFKPQNYKNINGGESFSDLINRVNEFLRYLRKLYAEGAKNILVVTHGAFIKALVMVVKNNSLDKFWNEPYVYNLSLTVMEYSNNSFFITKESEENYYL